MRSVFAWLVKNIFVFFYIPWERKVLKEELDYFEHNDLRGYTVLTFTPYQLSNLGIGGKYKHAEMVVGPHTMTAARTDGFKARSIRDVLRKAQRYVVLEPVGADPEMRRKVAAWSLDRADEGIRYDFEIQLENGLAWYCTEAIKLAWNKVAVRFFNYGKMLFPDEFYHDKKMWRVVKEVNFAPNTDQGGML